MSEPLPVKPQAGPTCPKCGAGEGCMCAYTGGSKPQAEPREKLSAFLRRTRVSPDVADIEYFERSLDAAVERAERAEKERDGPVGITATPSAAARIRELVVERDAAVERAERLEAQARRYAREAKDGDEARAERDEAMKLLRGFLAVSELSGTRSEIEPAMEKAKSAARAFLSRRVVAPEADRD